MAATLRTTAAGGGTSGTTDRTVAITPAVGDLLVAFATVSGNTDRSPSMTDNNASGGGWALVGQCRWNTSADMLVCWVRKALMANTTSTTITAVTGSNTAAEIVVCAYSGMTRVGLNAIRQWTGQENQASGGTPTPVFYQAALTANPTIVAVGSGDTTTTPNASWTEQQDVSQATPTTALEVATRASGFTGTSIAAGATQSTVFASMAVELDSSASTFGLGAMTGGQRFVGGAFPGTYTTPSITTTNNSTFLIGLARGWWTHASPVAPSDSKSNTYSVVGSVYNYASFPDSAIALYLKQFGSGGASHTASAAYGSIDSPGTSGDEVTEWLLEFTGDLVYQADSHVSRTGATTITSGTVTTTAKALLLCVVWGTNVTGVTHYFLATPSEGFTKLTDVSFEGDPDPSGYIQCSVFYKIVDAAGTYSCTVNGQGEGAEIQLAAFQVGAAPISGAANDTIAAVTSSAAGTVKVQAAANDTIAAVTSSAAGAVHVQGTESSTIAAVTPSAAGAVHVQGTETSTIDPVTPSAAGTVGNSAVSGALAATIDPVSPSGAGAVHVQGSEASTIAAVTPSAAGAVHVQGSESSTIDPVSSSAAAAAHVSGSEASTIDAVSPSAAGAVHVSGSEASTIAPVTAVATGAAHVSGATTATIAPVTPSAAGTIKVQGSESSTIAAVTPSAAGAVHVQGTETSTIDPVAISATGTGQDVVIGDLAVTVDPVSSSASGTVLVVGASSAVVGGVSPAATGAVIDHGTGVMTVPAVGASASGAVVVRGAVAATIPDVSASAAGSSPARGALATLVAPVTSSAATKIIVAGAVGSLIDPVSGAGAGIVQDLPTISGNLSSSIGLFVLSARNIRYLIAPAGSASGGATATPVATQAIATEVSTSVTARDVV